LFKHTSITVKFILLFIFTVLLIGAAYALALRNIYETELQSQARTIADNVEAFGAWVSQYGRVWVRDGKSGHLSEVSAVSVDKLGTVTPAGPAPDSVVQFYSKNPALAQREYSEVVERSPTPAKFRMTSDNYMNPTNRPDNFEENALLVIKSQNLKEYSTISGNVYRYTRALYHKESCIKCHGDPANAPADVTAKYGTRGGFGFKVGDVAGIISVKLPAPPLWQVGLKVFGPVQIGLVVAAFVLAFLFIRLAIIAPVRRLTRAAEQLSTGRDADLGLASVRQGSGNEIHQLAFSLNRLRTSLQIALQRMRAAGGGKDTTRK